MSVELNKEEELKKIANELTKCQRCPLYKPATNPVPGNGNPQATIMLVGEAPGFWEDQKGIPFCGAAGKLLDELLVSINLDREKVFVTNMLKHRPPGNREPLPEEIESCRPFLDRQIEIIQPKVMVTLGRFSLAKFLPLGKITNDHGKGRILEYNGRRFIFIPMFHPAAALRGAEVERQLREDFKKILEEIRRLERVMNEVAEVKTTAMDEKKEEQLTLV